MPQPFDEAATRRTLRNIWVNTWKITAAGAVVGLAVWGVADQVVRDVPGIGGVGLWWGYRLLVGLIVLSTAACWLVAIAGSCWFVSRCVRERHAAGILPPLPERHRWFRGDVR